MQFKPKFAVLCSHFRILIADAQSIKCVALCCLIVTECIIKILIATTSQQRARLRLSYTMLQRIRIAKVSHKFCMQRRQSKDCKQLLGATSVAKARNWINSWCQYPFYSTDTMHILIRKIRTTTTNAVINIMRSCCNIWFLTTRDRDTKNFVYSFRIIENYTLPWQRFTKQQLIINKAKSINHAQNVFVG